MADASRAGRPYSAKARWQTDSRAESSSPAAARIALRYHLIDFCGARELDGMIAVDGVLKIANTGVQPAQVTQLAFSFETQEPPGHRARTLYCVSADADPYRQRVRGRVCDARFIEAACTDREADLLEVYDPSGRRTHPLPRHPLESGQYILLNYIVYAPRSMFELRDETTRMRIAAHFGGPGRRPQRKAPEMQHVADTPNNPRSGVSPSEAEESASLAENVPIPRRRSEP